MSEIHRFAMFPYLVTSKPVHVCSITFRSTNDIEGLSEEARKHLKAVSSLFFLQDHLQIQEMTYAYLPFAADQEADYLLVEQLGKAQMFFAYLYASPGYNGGPFYGDEHSSVYLLNPSRVSKYSLWQEHKVNSLWPEQHWPEFDQFHNTPGYGGYLNWTTYISAISGSRIYPPSPRIWLNYGQDLYADLMRYEANVVNWAPIAFFNAVPKPNSELERRIFNSVRWHNRSASLSANEDVALLHLAIALESLLNLEPGEKVTERFKETVRTLLGPIPRLEWWADQFYQARSKIAHQGSWPHLQFYPADKDQRARILKGQVTGEPYRSLLDYGRRIFRLCLNTILAGALHSEDAKLSSSFVPNGERIENIKQTVSNDKLPAEKRLKAVAREVLELHEFNRLSEDTINLGLLVAVGRSLCQVFLDAGSNIPVDVEANIRAILSAGKDVSTTEKLDHYEKLAQSLKGWKGPTPIYHKYSNEDYQIEEMEKDPSFVLWVFMEYASGPFLRMQASREEIMPKPT